MTGRTPRPVQLLHRRRCRDQKVSQSVLYTDFIQSSLVMEASPCGPQEQTQWKHSCGCPVFWQARPLPWRPEHPSAWGVRTPRHIPASCRSLYLLYGHILSGSGRSSLPRRASPLSVRRCYGGLFVIRGPLFSSVASVSCSSTGGVTCLCVRLFLAVGQLNPLGPDCSCAPAEPSAGSYCLWCSDLRFDGEQKKVSPGDFAFCQHFE